MSDQKLITEIVDTCVRWYLPRRNVVLLDGARERMIASVIRANPIFKNEAIEAVRRAFEEELDFSSGHPFLEGMFFDMGA